jgi:hypothetical protein
MATPALAAPPMALHLPRRAVLPLRHFLEVHLLTLIAPLEVLFTTRSPMEPPPIR